MSRRLPIGFLVGAGLLALASWGAYGTMALIQQDEDAHSHDQWIPGDRANVEICIDAIEGTVSRDEAAAMARDAILESRRSRPEFWVGAYESEPTVTTGCPAGPMSYSPGLQLEHRVEEASGPLLFVFAQPNAARVPGGYVRMPYEVVGFPNGYTATAVLFVDEATLRSPERLQVAMETGLAMGLTDAPAPDGPPNPDATKPAAPTAAP